MLKNLIHCIDNLNQDKDKNQDKGREKSAVCITCDFRNNDIDSMKLHMNSYNSEPVNDPHLVYIPLCWINLIFF